MKNIFQDERQIKSSLWLRSRAWSRGSSRTCHWLAKWIHWLSRLQCQEQRTTLSWLLRLVLCFWTMDILYPCSDSKINSDVSSLYVEIIDKNQSYYKCTICGRKLAMKQNLKTHLSCVHGKGENYHKPITILNAITNRLLPSFLLEKDTALGSIRDT